MTKVVSGKTHQRPRKRQKKVSDPKSQGSNEEVLLADVRRLLASQSVKETPNGEIETTANELPAPLKRFSEVEVKISEISSTGDGLGFVSSSEDVYVVPFTAPGDIVRAKVVNHCAEDRYILTDFLSIVTPSPKRDDTRIGCQYFARCSGCQFQMLSYQDQLAHKKTIIERAYKNFCTLAPDLIPSIGDTIGSPLQYGYRTKLTPHFNRPRENRNGNAAVDGDEREHSEIDTTGNIPPIGFMFKGRRKVLDIEDCPIGTDAVRVGMKSERERVAREIKTYKNGATLLLRESTIRTPISADSSCTEPILGDTTARNTEQPTTRPSEREDAPHNRSTETLSPATKPNSIDSKICITDFNATTTEYVDSYQFKNTAGAFFQTNNSILPCFTAYIRENILPFTSAAEPIKYLIDAYCGSGLFTVTLSSLFTASMGIDIDPASIFAARSNASANNISNTTFMAASASALFKEVRFAPEETVVVIDPPRKGCDDEFLSQLLLFGPRRIVYVSCNVHTQARDVSVLVDGRQGSKYDIESLRGFDFFPQTGHVESVAILSRSRELGSKEGEEAEVTVDADAGTGTGAGTGIVGNIPATDSGQRV